MGRTMPRLPTISYNRSFYNWPLFLCIHKMRWRKWGKTLSQRRYCGKEVYNFHNPQEKRFCDIIQSLRMSYWQLWLFDMIEAISFRVIVNVFDKEIEETVNEHGVRRGQVCRNIEAFLVVSFKLSCNRDVLKICLGTFFLVVFCAVASLFVLKLSPGWCPINLWVIWAVVRQTGPVNRLTYTGLSPHCRSLFALFVLFVSDKLLAQSLR